MKYATRVSGDFLIRMMTECPAPPCTSNMPKDAEFLLLGSQHAGTLEVLWSTKEPVEDQDVGYSPVFGVPYFGVKFTRVAVNEAGGGNAPDGVA